MTNNNRFTKNEQNKVLFALLFPFLAFAISFSSLKSKSTKYIFYLFFVWCAFAYSYKAESIVTSDAASYAKHFKVSNSFKGSLSSFYKLSSDQEKFDFYRLLSVYYLSRITDNARLLFVFYGIVFSYFFVSNLWYIINMLKDRLKGYSIVLFVILLLIVPIWEGLNNSRMNLAIQVFIYSILPFLLEKKMKRIPLLMAVPFIHFSMGIAVILFLIYLFLPKNKPLIFIFLFILTFLTNQIDINFIREQVMLLPYGYDERIGGYISDTSLNQHENWLRSSSLIYILNFNYRQYFVFILIILLTVTKSKYIFDSPFNRFLLFTLFIYSLANILAYLPSGFRFWRIGNSLFFMWLILSINHFQVPKLIKTYFGLSIPLLAFGIVFGIRTGLDYFGPHLFFGNFVSSLFYEDIFSIMDLIIG